MHIALAASVMLLLCACDGARRSAPDAGSPDAAGGFDPSRIELGEFGRDFCAPWARIVCERAERCACGATVPGGALDVEGCVSRKTADCVRRNGPSLEAGAVLDVRTARACLAEIERQPECGRLEIPRSCGALLFLPIAIGAECTAPFPAFCAGNDGSCFPGSTCQRRRREGEACGAVCAPGLFCSDETRRCVALGEEGAPCRTADECDPALRCVGALLAGTCRAPVGEGGACSATAECAVGLECARGACAPADESRCRCGAIRLCAPTASSCQPRRIAGETCAETRECAADLACGASEGACVARPIEGESCGLFSAPCAPGLGCRIDEDGAGTCVPAPGDGEACGAVRKDGQPICADGLLCVTALGSVCAAPQPEGAPCSLDECAAGLRCVDGICSTGAGEGESCEAFLPTCAEGLYCYGEACRPAVEDGAHCDGFRPCVHHCVPDATGGRTCAPASELGDPCGNHEQCADDHACLAGERTCVAEICQEL